MNDGFSIIDQSFFGIGPQLYIVDQNATDAYTKG